MRIESVTIFWSKPLKPGEFSSLVDRYQEYNTCRCVPNVCNQKHMWSFTLAACSVRLQLSTKTSVSNLLTSFSILYFSLFSSYLPFSRCLSLESKNRNVTFFKFLIRLSKKVSFISFESSSSLHNLEKIF